MIEYTELDEAFGSKNMQQLQNELKYQIEQQGELEGGTICSYIQQRIKLLTNDSSKER